MPESASKKSKPILSVLAIGLLLYSSANISSTLLHSLQNRQRLQDLQQQVAQLQQKRHQLQQALVYEQSSMFIEQTARNQLGLAKPNETVVIFPRQQDVLGANTPAMTAMPQQPIAPNLQKWTNFFWK
jgi:cell division protein FtsB